MFKVTNKAKDVRKFRDNQKGKDIYVNPKGFVITNRPPEANPVWKIELLEKPKVKKTIEVNEQ